MRARTPDGYNPIVHKCENGFCYNDTYRMRVEVFAECFQGRNAFSDADGPGVWHWIERYGRVLGVEAKRSPVAPEHWQGQYTAFTRLSASHCSHDSCKRLCVYMMLAIPDVTTMEVTHYGSIVDGRWGGWLSETLDGVKNRMRAWESWAQRHSRLNDIHSIIHPTQASPTPFDEDWRTRAIDAALNGCTPEFKQELYCRLRREAKETVGSFIDTPLAKAMLGDQKELNHDG
jgi:hypothetical protein